MYKRSIDNNKSNSICKYFSHYARPKLAEAISPLFFQGCHNVKECHVVVILWREVFMPCTSPWEMGGVSTFYEFSFV